MKKICIIGVYFGKLPNYFSLWLKSCQQNDNVDFLIFSDQATPFLPRNVKMIPMTLAEMKQRAEKVLGFPVRLEQPYKCCDYKVIYGLIFEDFVREYSYWGHCDFDLIFGDLCSFFEKYELEKYDRFLALGHLSLYRNTDEVNKRYLCTGSMYDYKQTYTTDKITVFDEIPGITAIYLKHGFSMFTKRVFADIASIHHRYRVIEDYQLDKTPQNYQKQIFYWENGKTFRGYIQNGKVYEEEYLYIHFKKRPNFSVNFDFEKNNAFYITNQGFFPKTGEITAKIIDQLNHYPGWLYEWYEKNKFTINQIKNKILRRLKN